ncbi:MAG: TrkA family potassium uptake protein [Terriglobia bacterium]
MPLRRQLVVSFLLLFIVVMLAAIGYRVLGGPHISSLDAIYMAIITVATVGYGEIVDTAANPHLRIFNIFVIFFGIGIMLYVFSASTAFIVEGELKDIFRRRKMLKQIRNLKDHFIVCGAGETAHHVVQELLKTGHPLVVIDHDEERLEKIRHLGEFPVLTGEAADEAVLESAGLSYAAGLAVVLPDDKDNLMVTVTARQMSSTVRIIARCTDARMGDKLIRAGASAAVSPNMIGGMRMASELVRPHVVSFLDLMLREKSKTLRVEEIEIREASVWASKTIHETEIHPRFDLLALAVRNSAGAIQYNPHGDTVLHGGDVLIVMGNVEQVWKAREAAG